MKRIGQVMKAFLNKIKLHRRIAHMYLNETKLIEECLINMVYKVYTSITTRRLTDLK